MPPPASSANIACGQWSRPALGLIFGVRPNSPVTNTEVESSKPRCDRFVSRADRPSSSSGSSFVLERLEILAVRVPAAVSDRDEPHARFDQPRGQQAALAERVFAELSRRPAVGSRLVSNALRATGELMMS